MCRLQCVRAVHSRVVACALSVSPRGNTLLRVDWEIRWGRQWPGSALGGKAVVIDTASSQWLEPYRSSVLAFLAQFLASYLGLYGRPL